MEGQYDVVLIDSPPSVGKLAALGTLASDVLKVRSVQDQASSVRVFCAGLARAAVREVTRGARGLR
ncbi:hypothetical protein GCM10008961_30420 [Deinococcus knuensis]|uniref:AAA domain-containing protein n=1 Tax=Deinococcus knuensis TaxID=1837380 RepID=A0ABQ2SSH9_9DEIO|nr:hypothetical protein GCM10008961_30420 [Deinococcus knuensis]